MKIYIRAVRLNCLENQLVELNANLELATNEESLDRVVALRIEMDVMKAEKIALETQTEEQRAAAYAQKCKERQERDAERDAEREHKC
jgi:hypothetical protein